jgi:uncharacterized membrane protein YfcA
MPTDPLFYIIGLFAVFVLAFGKGAFGGGFAVIGVPILALVIDPITASIMMAPIASASDPFGIWAYPPRTWSWRDLVWLIPGIVVGLTLGATFFVSVDPHLVALAIALVTLWFLGGAKLPAPGEGTPVQPLKALICSTISGFITFIAHGGNPPMAYYLLPRGLDKTSYAGTQIAVFVWSNSVKLVMYVFLFHDRPIVFLMALSLMPALPLGVWLGKRLHERLDARKLYLTLYLLLGATGMKLLVNSVVRLVG